jgi:hypothetical protein
VAAAEMQARVSPPLLKNDRCEGEIWATVYITDFFPL